MRASRPVGWVAAGLDGLASSFHYETAERLLRTAVYAWCIFWAASMAPAAGEVWGPNASVVPYAKTVLGASVAPHRPLLALDLLSEPSVAPHYPLFVAGFLTASTIGLIGRWPRSSSIATWLLFQVLAIRAHALEDGGDRLVAQLLFYGSVATLLAARPPGPGVNALRNLVFLCARVQVCVLYATAALSKLSGTLWPAGEAMYYVIHTDEYTWPLLRDAVGQSSGLLATATYATLAFQLSFPVLIWVPAARRPLMLFGTVLHAQIALVMGIVTFGLAMIVAYLAFYREDEARATLARFDASVARLRALATPTRRLAASRGGMVRGLTASVRSAWCAAQGRPLGGRAGRGRRSP